MDIFLLVIGSMLAAIGLVQIIGWLVCRGQGKSEESSFFQVTRLHRELAKLEDQLRYEVLLAHWNTSYRQGILVLVDDGLCKDAKKMCRQMAGGLPGAIICTPEEVARLVSHDVT